MVFTDGVDGKELDFHTGIHATAGETIIAEIR